MLHEILLHGDDRCIQLFSDPSTWLEDCGLCEREVRVQCSRPVRLHGGWWMNELVDVVEVQLVAITIRNSLRPCMVNEVIKPPSYTVKPVIFHIFPWFSQPLQGCQTQWALHLGCGLRLGRLRRLPAAGARLSTLRRLAAQGAAGRGVRKRRAKCCCGRWWSCRLAGGRYV